MFRALQERDIKSRVLFRATQTPPLWFYKYIFLMDIQRHPLACWAHSQHPRLFFSNKSNVFTYVLAEVLKREEGRKCQEACISVGLCDTTTR